MTESTEQTTPTNGGGLASLKLAQLQALASQLGIAGGSRMRKDARSVLIVGAGDGGRLLLREIMRNPELGYRPVGFIDDDPRKEHARVDRGLQVLGTTDQLGHVLDDVEPDEVRFHARTASA